MRLVSKASCPSVGGTQAFTVYDNPKGRFVFLEATGTSYDRAYIYRIEDQRVETLSLVSEHGLGVEVWTMIGYGRPAFEVAVKKAVERYFLKSVGLTPEPK